MYCRGSWNGSGGSHPGALLVLGGGTSDLEVAIGDTARALRGGWSCRLLEGALPRPLLPACPLLAASGLLSLPTRSFALLAGAACLGCGACSVLARAFAARGWLWLLGPDRVCFTAAYARNRSNTDWPSSDDHTCARALFKTAAALSAAPVPALGMSRSHLFAGNG